MINYSTLLCYYDRRNPNGAIDEFEGEELIQTHEKIMLKNNSFCHCDNCFTGKTELAEYILKSNELLKISANRLQDNEENGYNNHTAMKIYKHLGID